MKMTKAAAIISACMLTLGLSACSSNYVMHTNDGRTIVTGKPQTDNDTGMISYKDAWGNKQQINRSDVKQLGELDEGSKGKKHRALRCYIKSLWTDRVNVQEVKRGSFATVAKQTNCKTTTQHHNRKPKAMEHAFQKLSFRLRKCRHYRYLLVEPQRTIYNGSDKN